MTIDERIEVFSNVVGVRTTPAIPRVTVVVWKRYSAHNLFGPDSKEWRGKCVTISCGGAFTKNIAQFEQKNVWSGPIPV